MADGRRAWAALFALALLVQLLVLYLPDLPDLPSPLTIPGLDKLVHAAVFLAPALLGTLAGLRPGWLAGTLVAHAVVSEVVQQHLVAERSGDLWDAVADVVGVGAGLALGWAMHRRGRRRRARLEPS